MKKTTIFKDIFFALVTTVVYGGFLGAMGNLIFGEEVSTMIKVAIVIFIITLLMFLYNDYEKAREKRANEQACKEQEEKLARMKEEKRRLVSSLEQKYGHCSYVMSQYKAPFSTDIVRIYPQAHIIIIQGKEYAFDDILSCHISEHTVNDTIMKTHRTTTTDETHVARRIAAGAMIGGKKGAILAAFTTRPRTVTSTTYSYHPITRSKYSVVVSVRHPHPEVTIYMNEDYSRAHRLMQQINSIHSYPI